MNPTPLISICIPTYNQTIHLKKLIHTILSQKEVNYEIIITDDSSTDEVQHLIQEFNSNLESNTINYYRNTPALGAPENWNFGLSLAKGDYIKPMHHDQWFEDEYALKKLLDKIIDKKNTFVFSAAKSIFRGETSDFRIKPDDLTAIIKEPEKLILANLIGGPTAILYPKEANLIFDEKIIWLVDVEFYLQLFNLGYEVEYIDECLYTSMTDFDSLTNNNLIDTEKQLYEYSYLFNKFMKKYSLFKRIKYVIEIFNILKLQLNPKSYLTQFIRLLKRII
jgi:glycosyltransferase involved in cell wall biosynthesis